MTNAHKHQAIADRWTGLDCYLDGQLASVCGRQCEYAMIITRDNGKRAQFAWPTVNHIMNRHMEFKTA